MFEKKRNSIIKVIIILLILISINVFINIPFVNAGRWVYNSTVEDIYNITISSDDAVAVIDNYFKSNGESITLKSNIYSSIIGLRFDNISIPSNSTYEYRPVNAYLSLYSDHYPYDPLSEKVTIYFETDNYDIQTYINYTNLVSRSPSYNSRNWDLDDVHGLNSTTGQWNDSPNIVILVTGATGFDDDTISFLIYSDRGVWFRYFRTIDHYVGYAPRLHIISQIYEWQELTPTGYDYAELNDTYRGYDVWLDQTSNKIDMVYWNGTYEYYMEINTNSDDVEIPDVSSSGNPPSSRQIARGLNQDIVYIGRNGTEQYLYHSYDEGLTWEGYCLNDQFENLDGHDNKDGSLAFDSFGVLWVVWSSKSDTSAVYDVQSTNVEIIDHVVSFNTVEEAGDKAQPNERPTLWIDGNNRKHLVWDSEGGDAFDQIWYKYKVYGAWSSAVRISNGGNIHHRDANIMTSENGSLALVVALTKTNDNLIYSPTINGWPGWTQEIDEFDDFGAVVSYNDNEDRVMMIYSDDGELAYFIYDFKNTSLTSKKLVGVDGSYPDLTFDIVSNELLAVYDAGIDGVQGIIYYWDTDSWGSNFSIRDVNPTYIHTVDRATIDIGGGEDDYIWIVVDDDLNIIVILDVDDYPTIDDVEAWIDNYLSASSEYDKTPWMGDFTLLLVGLVGIAFIPLGFLIFVSSVRDGDIIGGLQTLVLMFFIGIGCIVAWLWA